MGFELLQSLYFHLYNHCMVRAICLLANRYGKPDASYIKFLYSIRWTSDRHQGWSLVVQVSNTYYTNNHNPPRIESSTQVSQTLCSSYNYVECYAVIVAAFCKLLIVTTYVTQINIAVKTSSMHVHGMASCYIDCHHKLMATSSWIGMLDFN